ncbi:4316_t:CDS:2, partial [Dentiscutata erythropus]
KAKELQKPLVIHTREAEEDTWDILTKHVPKDWKIHVHCFTDSPNFAKKLLDYFPNLYIGITAKLNKNKRTNEKVTVSHSGMIPFIAQRIAEITGKEIDVIMRAARENTRN